VDGASAICTRVNAEKLRPFAASPIQRHGSENIVEIPVMVCIPSCLIIRIIYDMAKAESLRHESTKEPQKRPTVWQSRSELARVTQTDRLAADTYHELIDTGMLTTRVSCRRESAARIDAGTAAPQTQHQLASFGLSVNLLPKTDATILFDWYANLLCFSRLHCSVG
jgi:hypothetical protein